MRRECSAARQIQFIKNNHEWLDFCDEDNICKAKCKNCGIIAMQDLGSLCYFVIAGNAYKAYLTCEQLIIKNIIE